ncbi:uncharacterized protein LOC105848562 [Hydra vulgaris]|uniref:Uncharacterized protein LOC105848562 n=1 Tax=Hydra vulgaris TaxID=6087 RepID=A0ABM4BIK6_HYDVU
MLKHTSSRNELRQFGSFSDFEQKDNLTNEFFEDTFHSTFENELQFELTNEESETADNGELYENTTKAKDQKHKQPNVARLKRNRSLQIAMGEAEEITEEVRLNNSKLVIHRRKPLKKNSRFLDESLSLSIDERYFENGDSSKNNWSNVSESAVSDLSNSENEGYKIETNQAFPSYRLSNVVNQKKSFSAFLEPNLTENSLKNNPGKQNGGENHYRSEKMPSYYNRQSQFTPTFIENTGSSSRLSKNSHSTMPAKLAPDQHNVLGRSSVNRTSSYSAGSNSNVNHLEKSFMENRDLDQSKHKANHLAPENSIMKPSIKKSIVLENKYLDNEQSRNVCFVTTEQNTNVATLKVQKTKWILAILILIVAVFCAVGSFIHYYVGHYPEKEYLNQADVLLLGSLSDFCGGITAKSSEESGIRIINFKLITSQNALKYTKSERTTIFPSSFWKRQFKFLKGSYVRFKIVTDDEVEMFIFVGEQNYTIWSQRKESETYLKMKSCCSSSKKNEGELELVAERDDVYIFTLFNDIQVLPVNVYIELEFHRKSYDFTQTVATCTSNNKNSCFLPVPFNSNDRIALEVPLANEAGVISKSNEIEWKCEARVWLFCLVYIGGFLATAIVIILVRYIYIRIQLRRTFLKCQTKYVPNDKYIPNYSSYYDNFGQGAFTVGNSYLENNMTGISSRSLNSASRLTNKTPSRLTNRTSSRLTNSSKYMSGWNTERTDVVSACNVKNKSVSLIYNEQKIDQTDSGISDDQEYSPIVTQCSTPSIRQPVVCESLNDSSAKNNLMLLQDLKFDENSLKYQRRAQLVAGPRIENIIQKKNFSEDGLYFKKSQHLYPSDNERSKYEYQTLNKSFHNQCFDNDKLLFV